MWRMPGGARRGVHLHMGRTLSTYDTHSGEVTRTDDGEFEEKDGKDHPERALDAGRIIGHHGELHEAKKLEHEAWQDYLVGKCIERFECGAPGSEALPRARASSQSE